jgi:hypothetical protein
MANRRFLVLRLLLALIIALAAGPAIAQYPREGIAGIPNAAASLFAGSWQMATGGGVVYPCDGAVVITEVDDTTIHYVTSDGVATDFPLEEADGATLWLQPPQDPMIAVWTSADTFNLHLIGFDGELDWDFPFVISRCN